MTTPTTVQARFQLRADTAANWTSVNPVLLNNEFGLETDTKKLKVGNGSTAWNSLAYFPTIVSGGTVLGNLEIGTTGTLTFEGSTADGFETTLAVANPTADRTITLPNQSGNVIVSGNASIVNADISASAAIAFSKLASMTAGYVLIGNASNVPTVTQVTGDVTISSSGVTSIASGAIVDADVSASAEIAVSKLADGAARQLLQTDAAGTGVEWTDNVDIPGTLDVTGAATFDGAVTIAGDLTVNGTTTNINTQNLVVEDKNVILGDVATPTDVTADGGGITLKGATDKTINWVDATDAWTLSEHVNIANGKEYRIDGTKVLDATSLGSSVLISSSNIPSGTIVDDDISASAEIAVSKLADGAARQLLQTDSAGTGVEWTDNVDVPGTLDVTSTATFDSIISASAGAAATPSITFTGDVNTGIYSPGADQLGFSTGGTGRMLITQDGRVLVGSFAVADLPDGAGSNFTPSLFSTTTSGTAGIGVYVEDGTNNRRAGLFVDQTNGVWGLTSKWGTGQADFVIRSGGSERARIDSSGRLLVGTSTALSTRLGGATVQTPALQLAGTTVSASSTSFWGFSAAPANSSYITFSRSLSGTVGTNTAVTNGTSLGGISFAGFDGTNQTEAARILVVVDGTPGTDDMPGRIVLSTTTAGSSSPTERMRINSSGQVLIGRTAASYDTQLEAEKGIYSATGFGNFPYWNYGPVESITIVNGGSGYTDGTYVGIPLLTGGTAWGVTADFTVSGGVITAATVAREGRPEQNYAGAVLTLQTGTDLGAGGTGLSLTVASVRTAYFGHYANPARMRLGNSTGSVAAGTELGSILFSNRDTSSTGGIAYGGAGDTARIYARAVSTIGGGYFDFWTAANGGQAQSTMWLNYDGTNSILRIRNPGDSNTNFVSVLRAEQATATTARNGGQIVFGRENANSWAASTTDCDGYIAFSPVLDNTNTERMRITSAGFVGIGTSSPTDRLHVVGSDGPRIEHTTTSTFNLVRNTTAGESRLNFSNSVDTKAAQLRINWAGQTFGAFEVYAPSSTSNGQNLVLEAGRDSTVFYTTNTERLRITSAGLVGIGTSSPAGALNVQGSTAAPALTYDTANIANFDAGTIQLALGIHDAPPFGAYLQGRDTGNSSRVISLNPAGGNVGIGTTSPVALLSLDQTVSRGALTTTAPARLYAGTGTITDNTTAASGTAAHGTIVAFDNPAIAASNTGVTYTNASTVYIDGAPTASTNVTITNAFSLFVAAGNSRFGGNVLSSSATGGIGYATGAGGAVTQGTSRTTGVTLNNVCGAITLVSAAGSTTWASFTVTNSTVAATDNVIVNQKSGTDLYMIHVTNIAAGSFRITFATTGGTTTEQPVFNFSVIKAVAA